ncbi:hypothetical protein V9T40_010688 [Parthenolecanium corni]|uniref:Kazal-like domain-containing protein n=1 Tax=Parthenolecanium corni TaxID=536013 RepID=A0AAN9T404_9HEMI
MIRVLLGFAITAQCVFGSPLTQETQRVKRQQGTLQETFEALQNLQGQQSQQGSNRPSSGSSSNNQRDPNLSSSGNQRPSGSNSGSSNFDVFNGPGFGGANGGSGGSNNQQRPGSNNNNQGFDASNSSASNSGRPNANQQGVGGSGSRPATTVRSPLNVVSNENTIPEANCVRNCMAVSTYDPVCGSDNITYTNRAKFRCAQNCGRSK